MFESFCRKFSQAMSFKRSFLFLTSFPCKRSSDMRGSRLQKLIWIGTISENVSLRVISVVAKFHAFIISLNNFGR